MNTVCSFLAAFSKTLMDKAPGEGDSTALVAEALRQHRMLGQLPRSELEQRYEALCAEAAAEQAAIAALPSGPLVGTCDAMCPQRELLSRVLAGERIAKSESDANVALSLTKRFVRSAAGAPPPLPAEVRSPQTLVHTLSLLLGVPVRADCYAALENRVRAVRSDLLVQQVHPRLSLFLLGRIARWYISCMSVLRDSASVDHHLIVDQVRKVLSTLLSVYPRKDGDGSDDPLFDEFYGYHILCNINDPFSRSSHFAWSLPYTRQCLSLLLDFQSLNFHRFFRRVPDFMAGAFVAYWSGPFRARALEMIGRGLRTAEPEMALEQMVRTRPPADRSFGGHYLRSGNIDFRMAICAVRAYVLRRVQARRLYSAAVTDFCSAMASAGARRRTEASRIFRRVSGAFVRQVIFSIVVRRFIKCRFCIKDQILIVCKKPGQRNDAPENNLLPKDGAQHSLFASLYELLPATRKHTIDFCAAEDLSEDFALRFVLTVFLATGKTQDSTAYRMLNTLVDPGPEEVRAAVEAGGICRIRLSEALSGRPLREQLAILSRLRRHMGRDYEHTVQAVLDGHYFRDRVIYVPATVFRQLDMAPQ